MLLVCLCILLIKISEGKIHFMVTVIVVHSIVSFIIIEHVDMSTVIL